MDVLSKLYFISKVLLHWKVLGYFHYSVLNISNVLYLYLKLTVPRKWMDRTGHCLLNCCLTHTRYLLLLLLLHLLFKIWKTKCLNPWCTKTRKNITFFRENPTRFLLATFLTHTGEVEAGEGGGDRRKRTRTRTRRRVCLIRAHQVSLEKYSQLCLHTRNHRNMRKCLKWNKKLGQHNISFFFYICMKQDVHTCISWSHRTTT